MSSASIDDVSSLKDVPSAPMHFQPARRARQSLHPGQGGELRPTSSPIAPGDRLHFGLRVEKAAAAWAIQELGARILVSNYRRKVGEIDLVAEIRTPRGVELVFFEVRARLPESWENALESIRFAKQRSLERVIRQFLAGYRGSAQSVRLDVLGWDGETFTHYPNVWLPYSNA